MGDKKEEQRCLNQAKEIRERLWHQQTNVAKITRGYYEKENRDLA